MQYVMLTSSLREINASLGMEFASKICAVLYVFQFSESCCSFSISLGVLELVLHIYKVINLILPVLENSLFTPFWKQVGLWKHWSFPPFLAELWRSLGFGLWNYSFWKLVGSSCSGCYMHSFQSGIMCSGLAWYVLDVGRSCILLSLGGKNIMLDCGMHMGYNDSVSL